MRERRHRQEYNLPRRLTTTLPLEDSRDLVGALRLVYEMLGTAIITTSEGS